LTSAILTILHPVRDRERERSGRALFVLVKEMVVVEVLIVLL
jgi:hypothetical protein